MCCSFNMKAAEEIYRESAYTDILSEMQKRDKAQAFVSSSLPKKYVKNGEPKTVPGRQKSLVLMLDAHTDLLAPGSVDSDHRGFTGVIGASGNFPLTSQEGFEILPGFNNIITLSSSQVVADDSLLTLTPDQRQCKFPQEST